MSDTSEQYIKMCDCEEVQGGWKPSLGDLTNIGITNGFESKGYLGIINGWYISQGVKDDLIWLPRQDQLQGMLWTTKKQHISFMLQQFTIWYERSNGFYLAFHEKYSMEQLWLAFVMDELYKKKWNGKE